MTLEEFGDLLDAYGGDAVRWPGERRAAAETLLTTSSEAAVMLAEARALDKVLATYQPPDRDRLAALTDRIVAASGSASVDDGHGAANIVRFPERRDAIPSLTASSRREATPLASGRRRQSGWQAAAALVASLVFGISVGLADLTPSPLAALAELASPGTTDSEYALSGLQIDGIDEEAI